jgi:glycosyltransferase involved in cell wall biosynthesis
MADKVVAHSEIARNVLVQDYAVPQKKIQVIPHGIDEVSSAGNEDHGENKSLRDNGYQIVSYFGLVRQGKGLEDLVRAWKRVKNMNAQLWIIGGKHPVMIDNCYENLVELIQDLRLESSIRFCGYVPDESLPSYLAKSDAFVFPYNEWGEVIASSGALSIVAPYLKPLIATDVPAFAHLKNMGAAVIVNKGDIDSLASAIMEVLTDTRTRNTLVTRLSKLILDSSWVNVAEKTASLYRDTLISENLRA